MEGRRWLHTVACWKTPRHSGRMRTFAGAIGELSLVREGTEKGFSLNSLLRKYNSLLIGRHLAEIFRKDFPLKFAFADANDGNSVQAQVTDEEGNNYSFKVEAREAENEDVLNLKEVGSPVIIIPENGDVELSDEIGTIIKLKQGEVGFVMASTSQVVMKAEKVKYLRLTLDG